MDNTKRDTGKRPDMSPEDLQHQHQHQHQQNPGQVSARPEAKGNDSEDPGPYRYSYRVRRPRPQQRVFSPETRSAGQEGSRAVRLVTVQPCGHDLDLNDDPPPPCRHAHGYDPENIFSKACVQCLGLDDLLPDLIPPTQCPFCRERQLQYQQERLLDEITARYPGALSGGGNSVPNHLQTRLIDIATELHELTDKRGPQTKCRVRNRSARVRKQVIAAKGMSKGKRKLTQHQQDLIDISEQYGRFRLGNLNDETVPPSLPLLPTAIDAEAPASYAGVERSVDDAGEGSSYAAQVQQREREIAAARCRNAERHAILKKSQRTGWEHYAPWDRDDSPTPSEVRSMCASTVGSDEEDEDEEEFHEEDGDAKAGDFSSVGDNNGLALSAAPSQQFLSHGIEGQEDDEAMRAAQAASWRTFALENSSFGVEDDVVDMETQAALLAHFEAMNARRETSSPPQQSRGGGADLMDEYETMAFFNDSAEVEDDGHGMELDDDV